MRAHCLRYLETVQRWYKECGVTMNEGDMLGEYSDTQSARKVRIVDSWVNKNKRIVYHTVQSDAHVKIYQVHNAEHAGFISTVTSAEGISHFFHRVNRRTTISSVRRGLRVMPLTLPAGVMPLRFLGVCTPSPVI